MPRFHAKKHTPLLAFLLLIALSTIAYYKQNIDIIDLPTYQKLLKEDRFSSAKIIDRNVVLQGDEGIYSIIIDGVDLEQLLEKVPVSVEDSAPYIEGIVTFLLFFFLLLLLIYFGKKEPKEEVSQPKMQSSLAPHEHTFYKKQVAVTSTVSFKDVAGIESVKDELMEVVDFLKEPQKYQDFGIRLPRGVLLIGPPGVGKTLIAKAVAGEANVPFFYQSGASFVQIYVGMGAKRVRELFASAKAAAPSIIFIDEIDAVGRSRVASHNDERDATLNQLLTEMDGFEESSNVIVIGATNQIDVLDEALLRSGRFDRRVFIGLPNLEEREAILRVHLEGKIHDLSYHDIAKMSVGFSGAALATLVNEAAIHALKREAKSMTKEDFFAVKEKVLLGKKRLLAYSDSEKEIQATYQAAKALCAYWYEIGFDKVSIIGSSFKDIEREIESRSQMLSKVKLYLSGMIATNIFYDETFSNAREDLAKAKILSQEMVERYGMGEGIFPTQIDASNILDEAIEDTEAFLFKMKDAISAVKTVLLEKESLSVEELKSVVDDFL
jgi:ATP-dependent metalloprotease FtsH